jgi:hypothetical protein
VSEGKLSARGARIVEALNKFADDLESGAPIEFRYTIRVDTGRPSGTGGSSARE